MTLPPLTREEVEALSGQVPAAHLDVLRWLVWLPLLTREELARTTRHSVSTLWNWLNQLTRLHLLDALVVNESGWPRRHHYYATDSGLYVLAMCHPQPLSVSRLAMSYPVMRADLLSRLARPYVHLVCSEFVTRLIAEHPQGYRLTSYQQPFKERYTDQEGKDQTLIFDAAFLLQTPLGTQHAFYVCVDQPEQMQIQREVKAHVRQWLALRQATHLAREVMPHLLLLSRKARFSFWVEQVNRVTLQEGIALLDVRKPEPAREQMDLSCHIAASTDLSKGAYTRIWTPFHTLIEQGGTVQANRLVGIESLLERVASPRLAERFSQYFTFQQVLLRSDEESEQKKVLTRYVNMTLHTDAAPFASRATPNALPSTISDSHSTPALIEQITEAFYGGPEERISMSALLTVALSDQQKEILAYLARHPYLGRSDLLALLHHQDERLLTRQMTPLIHLKLVKISLWDKAETWRERERYALCESALRFLACRHGRSPAMYLIPLLSKDQRVVSYLVRDVVWRERGAWGLWGKDGSQMFHTSGLYRCVRSIHLSSDRTHAYQVLSWKSAREALRWYRDPFTGEMACIRPDAELLYTTQESADVRSLLIEYDRDTTSRNQLASKFMCYAQYQQDMRITLPTILVITQNEQAIDKIWRARDEARAFVVSIVVVLEEDIAQDGLLPILGRLR
jgi:hypothetical protein